MSGTALSYITQAFERLNVFQPGATLPAAQTTQALAILNLMMGTWAQQFTSYATIGHGFPLIAGKGGPNTDYSVGIGGDIPLSLSNQNRLMGATLILNTSTVEIPLAILTDDMYRAIAIKTLPGSQPTAIYYSPQVGLGRLYLWPVPDNNVNGLGLYVEQGVGPFADLSTTVYTFPDGYDEAIVYNLERRLAGPYGRKTPS
jgi:hypothetical protein